MLKYQTPVNESGCKKGIQSQTSIPLPATLVPTYPSGGGWEEYSEATPRGGDPHPCSSRTYRRPGTEEQNDASQKAEPRGHERTQKEQSVDC